MTPRERLRAALYGDEGDVPYVYKDSEGFWTLGVGFLVDQAKGGRLPDVVRDFWLDHLIDEREEALLKALPWIATLDPVRKNVLLNMSYQLGVAGLLQFVTTLARVRDGRYADAAYQMLQSKWARQTPGRARRLAHEMETGEI